MGRWSVCCGLRCRRPSSPSEAFLLGQPEEEPLRALLGELGGTLRRMADVNRLQRCHEYRNSARPDARAEDVRSVAHDLAALSPDPARAACPKAPVARRLAELTARGGAEDIKGLRNLDLAPFADGTTLMRRAIASWVGAALRARSAADAAGVADVLGLAYSSQGARWGSDVREAVAEAFAGWDGAMTGALWPLWR